MDDGMMTLVNIVIMISPLGCALFRLGLVSSASKLTAISVAIDLLILKEDIKLYRLYIAGKWTTLIDPPGFDDTNE